MNCIHRISAATRIRENYAAWRIAFLPLRNRPAATFGLTNHYSRCIPPVAPADLSFLVVENSFSSNSAGLSIGYHPHRVDVPKISSFGNFFFRLPAPGHVGVMRAEVAGRARIRSRESGAAELCVAVARPVVPWFRCPGVRVRSSDRGLATELR